MDLTAEHIGDLIAASAAQERMCATISCITGAQCREPSLLPGWSIGHVLTHWARNADGQCRILAAAQLGEIAEQYPGGDAQRAADIDAGAARPAYMIVADARAAAQRAEAMWRSMPPGAWLRPTAARAGPGQPGCPCGPDGGRPTSTTWTSTSATHTATGQLN